MSTPIPTCPHCRTPLEEIDPSAQDCPACGGSIARDGTNPATAHGPRRRLALAVGVALAALGITGIGIAAWAGLLFSGAKPQRVARSAPVEPTPSRPAAPDPEATVLSRLTVTTTESTGQEGPSRLIVTLQRPGYHEKVPNGIAESLFRHEVVRQAVLAAARDSGAVVRDATIGDEEPVGKVVTEAEVGVLFQGDAAPTVTIWRRIDGRREAVATFDVARTPTRTLEDDELIAGAEGLVRGKLPEVLGVLGVKRQLPVVKEEGPSPQEVMDRLGQMTLTEPFVAARLIHARIQAAGVTPERLADLVRTYANLGMLTEFHWNSANKAFKARALLTAQRMVVDDPRSPMPRWHRAYARALAGLHTGALEDLAEAEKLNAGKQNAEVSTSPPSWVPVIDAFCRFQTSKLIAVGEGPDGQLAMMLAYVTVENSSSTARLVKIGHTVLNQVPECYRVHDAFSRVGGIGNFHTATLAGLLRFSAAIPQRLKAMPGLPADVLKIIRDSGPEPEMTAALVVAGRDAGDTSEPSWGALGRMLREVRFAQILRRAHFMKMEWSVPMDDFLTQMRPLYADHPYRALIDSYGIDWNRDLKGYADLIKGLTIPDLEITEYSVVLKTEQVDKRRALQLYYLATRHLGDLYHDLVGAVHRLPNPIIIESAKLLSTVSPHSPYWRAKLIEFDWAFSEPHAKEWEEDAGEHPEVLYALGARYSQLERWEDAERCLNRALTIAPEIATYKLLGWTYSARGDMNRWIEALERSLEVEDVGLKHEATRIEIARYYIQRQDYGKALLYAGPAAESWAGWAMTWAAYCHEALKQWDEAEMWERRQTERYPDSAWLDWYYFCKRTGHGDLANARRFVLDHIAQLGDHPSETARQTIANFHMIDGSPRDAFAIFQESAAMPKHLSTTLVAALLADELGETAERDRLLEELLKKPAAAGSKLTPIVRAIHAGLAPGAGNRIDPAPISAVLKDLPPAQQETVGILAARFLHAHGAPEDAKAIVRRIVEWPESSRFSRTWGILSLRSWEGDQPPAEAKQKPQEAPKQPTTPTPAPKATSKPSG